MNIKRNIIFSLESRRKNGVVVTDNIPVRMRVIYAGTRIDFTTGYRIDASKWDAEKQRVKNGCTNKLKQSASEINADLLMYYTDIQNIFKKFEVQNVRPTPEELKEAFANRNRQPETGQENIEEKPKILFNAAFDEFIRECGSKNSWQKSTYDKFRPVRHHIAVYDENVNLDKLDDEWFSGFIEYMKRLELRNNSIEIYFNFLKWFLRWSAKKGYTTNLAFASYKPKLKKTPKKVIFLTNKELYLFRDFAIPKTKKYLERTRDVFMFCCFTGLRHSDVFNLKRSDVKENHIEITTVKTTDNLVIELNKHSKSILEKYKNIPLSNDKALPVISKTRMNYYLKELAEMAQINEPVRETHYKGNQRIDEVTPKYALMGTHVARRTFICNALSLGIPPHVVMKWTGHSDYTAMKPYIDIADDIKVSAMDKFNQL